MLSGSKGVSGSMHGFHPEVVEGLNACAAEEADWLRAFCRGCQP